MNSSLVITKCDAADVPVKFDFGMFADAFINEVVSSPFLEKYLYCLWWGLKNLRYVIKIIS